MNATNPTRGEQELYLAGRKMIWRASLDTLVRIERACGRGVFSILQDPRSLKLEDSISIILLGLEGEKLDPVDLAKAKQSLWEAGMLAVFETTIKVLNIAAGGDSEQGNPLMPVKETPPH